MSYQSQYVENRLQMGGYTSRMNGTSGYATTLQIYPSQRPPIKYLKTSADNCSKTGTWDNVDKIKDCLSCVSKPGFYGETQTYCNGECMSKYNLGQICSVNSTYARNPDQCFHPCIKTDPQTCGAQLCDMDLDCNPDEICMDGLCVYSASGYTGSMSGFSGYTGHSGYSGDSGTSRYVYYTDKYGNERIKRENFDYDYSLNTYSSKTGFYDDKNLHVGVL